MLGFEPRASSMLRRCNANPQVALLGGAQADRIRRIDQLRIFEILHEVLEVLQQYFFNLEHESGTEKGVIMKGVLSLKGFLQPVVQYMVGLSVFLFVFCFHSGVRLEPRNLENPNLLI